MSDVIETWRKEAQWQADEAARLRRALQQIADMKRETAQGSCAFVPARAIARAALGDKP